MAWSDQRRSSASCWLRGTGRTGWCREPRRRCSAGLILAWRLSRSRQSEAAAASGLRRWGSPQWPVVQPTAVQGARYRSGLHLERRHIHTTRPHSAPASAACGSVIAAHTMHSNWCSAEATLPCLCLGSAHQHGRLRPYKGGLIRLQGWDAHWHLLHLQSCSAQHVPCAVSMERAPTVACALLATEPA